MAGLREGVNVHPSSLKAVSDNAGEMSPGSSTESYPAFARIGLRENPGKNLNQVTCPDRDSNPGHLVSQPDALTVTHRKGLGLRAPGAYQATRMRMKPGSIRVTHLSASADQEGLGVPGPLDLLAYLYPKCDLALSGAERSAEDAPFSIKSFLGYCYPPFDFLAAARVTAYSTPQVSEVVHLLYCLI
ncbi:hypothetical protein ANN_20944 [Periplaneta americana]|uniref:Uncharacterized protein n=1 Tax=Periplaneta americana TaxID=6978 RepID=A0ABQ8SE54_PERAM|nr:hypothetical protein ANN_20944 [Periplaneta americana]